MRSFHIKRILTKLEFYACPWSDDRSDCDWQKYKVELTGDFLFTLDDEHYCLVEEQIFCDVPLVALLYTELNDWAHPMSIIEAKELLRSQAVDKLMFD